MNNNKVLEVKNLTLEYKSKKVLEDVSFDLYEGEIVLLSGANGSGKSSLLSSIIGNLENVKSIKGNIIYDSTDLLKEKDIQFFRRLVGYVKQSDDFFEKTCIKEVLSSVDLFDGYKMSSNEVKDMFIEYGFENYINENPANLSGGQKRLLSILMALVRAKGSKLLLIDEPINNLDFNTACRVSNMITKIHKLNPHLSMLIVTHCHIFPIVDRVIKIEKGRILNSNIKYECHNCFGDVDENGFYNIN
ncbi:ATP-binding cassette domain-containing protein [Brachyspira aalborgi]|jgi:ABC-type multidrug transport system ATPase subunit|uniref:ATP-binding cassette domain-containing protein n=1 Tax=Brachyspira aalborgi TaxID=29522 RepID=A0AB38PZV8_9SPIR|nr:ATP-binding cassette domain-containing protein [Brachyspira aalborgi]TXJ14351.1 ATP-binding cassette domain-containing protein [Brachyspira aalborgi]TXJ19129.1 ATP-binding cassette domain-containing protein [Brachyspira aalborgi]TXJ25255.1 ATP-binding cassette domain-containing protein [Brachyspira aalborgi]TXJ47262.1 ATP-binding cassette domain-containing protein [Brachyspira aalborgi]